MTSRSESPSPGGPPAGLQRLLRLAVAAGIATAFIAGESRAWTPDGVDAVAGPNCISLPEPCNTVGLEFDRINADPARAVSVTIELSPLLTLCDPDPAVSIQQGPWLSAYPSFFQVIDLGGGVYTVDQAILGVPCGVTSGGLLFTVDVTGSGGDGTGQLFVTDVDVRDCDNDGLPGLPGDPAAVVIDRTPPPPVVCLSAVQEKPGADDDGTTEIRLFFCPCAGDATVEVYRAPYGYYPEYDDGGGAVPALPGYPPASPWGLTFVTADGQLDDPPVRDFWYYVAFAKDACGNPSAPSNVSAGTLNYHLGDVAPVGAPPGDNFVGTVDISGLSASYGKADGDAGYRHSDDVGPTTDYSVDGRPTTDKEIDFEDLLMFAINFFQVGPAPGQDQETPRKRESPTLVLRTGGAGATGLLAADLRLEGNVESVKGIHAVIGYDPAALEPLEAEHGSLLRLQSAPVFFKDLDRETGFIIDMAALGAGEPLRGSGSVASIRFRVLRSGSAPFLAEADLRDVNNRRTGLAGTKVGRTAEEISAVPAPAAFSLAAGPNPFRGTATLFFDLPETVPVRLAIYDVAGRRVRTLVTGEMPAGPHAVSWDGRGDDGRSGEGIYVYSLKAGDREATGKIFRIR